MPSSHNITEGYKPLWSHNFVAYHQDGDPELATNDEWRKIMVRARKQHDLTQEELGDDVGITQVMISKIESGAASASDRVLAICRRLSIPEPQHFANDDQREWSELGHALRHKGSDAYQAAIQLLRQLAKQTDEAAREPDPARTDRRK
jgi:transcriptional regulator with XRE-family HTH domain